MPEGVSPHPPHVMVKLVSSCEKAFPVLRMGWFTKQIRSGSTSQWVGFNKSRVYSDTPTDATPT